MDQEGSTAYAALLLRLALGVMYLAHGLMKVFDFGFVGTVDFFEAIGLPGILAYATIAGEVAGGILLILGIFTRITAIVLLPVLAGSIYWVHGAAGWLFANTGGGWEYSAFLIVVSVAVALLGPGAHAVARREVEPA